MWTSKWKFSEKQSTFYYANYNVTFQLELCGDIENNPGPVKTIETEPTHPPIVGFFIFVSTCILEWVFFHLEGMCSDH